MIRKVLVCVWVMVLAAAAGSARGQELISEHLEENEELFTIADVLTLARRAELTEDQRQMAMTVLEEARVEFVAAQRRLSRQRWLNNMEYWEIDEAKRGQWRKTAERRVVREYVTRLEEIEKETLGSLKVLVQERDRAWDGYLRQRRMYAFLARGSYAGVPPVERIIEGLGLNTDERRAVSAPLEEYLERLDGVVKEFLALTRQTRRAWESEEGVSDEQSRAYERRRVALVGKLVDTIDRGQKSIASVMTPDHAAAFLSRVEVAKVKQLMGEATFEDSNTVRDVLRISTLTPDQRSRMRAMIRDSEKEVARHFRELIPIMEASAAGRATNQQRKQEEAYQAAMKASTPVIARLHESLLTVLTAEQRTAFDEGAEPPLPADDERWGEDLDRRR